MFILHTHITCSYHNMLRMTQSVRMVVASFLVEYLRVNWVRGAEWFHYTLADADSGKSELFYMNSCVQIESRDLTALFGLSLLLLIALAYHMY